MTVEKWVLVITYLIVDMKPVMRLMGHNDNITKLQWNSFHRGLLASSSDDSSVCLWNVYIILTSQIRASNPLLFRHGGHRCKIIDFDFHPFDDWTYISCSNDGEMGGGTLQLWRLNDILQQMYENNSNGPMQDSEDSMEFD